MRRASFTRLLLLVCATLALAWCGGEPGDDAGSTGLDASVRDASIGTPDAAMGDGGARDASISDAGAPDAGSRDADVVDAGSVGDASVDLDAGRPDARRADRDRLLASYLAHLQSQPDVAQSNGLRGADLADVCDLWAALVPSGQLVFLTITDRLDGSILGSDGSTMLSHVTALYRVVGGQDATATDRGSCGGAEHNRMIMSMDATLHAALVATNTNRGAATAGVYDIADLGSGAHWRDSHDLGGPHAPFDQSDETNDGAPRGQVHYFVDPTSTLASSALGRVDLETLVDPFALEMDQDYDCVHSSNPSCDYTFYGAGCLPATRRSGLEIYQRNYRDVDVTYVPSGC
ncbi:MAG: hypothetical protein AB7S26_36435 [Sandaracinaceae bacterium]